MISIVDCFAMINDNNLMPECECGVTEGQLREFGRRWEFCPFCEIQFVENCEYIYELLGLKSRFNSPKSD